MLNHRDAGAFERVAPKLQDIQVEAPKENKSASQPASKPSVPTEDEVLVVVSKVKGYIRSKSGMNTSDAVMQELSERVRKFANLAIDQAQKHGRKTILDRDVS